ncbi:MAG: T9SS type A sorting domain-containing protein [Bacteroidetes bacterium]|nr:MAG: T9SS type A sorting domain-containing protein [Bacteroidota bacterium]
MLLSPFLRFPGGKSAFFLPALPPILLILFFTLGSAPAYAQSCGDPALDTLELSFIDTLQNDTTTHTVYFTGVTYDTAFCLSTWSYCVMSGGSPAVTSFAIGGGGSYLPCIDSSTVFAVVAGNSCIGTITCDTAGGGGSGICGLTFDCPTDSCVCFSITLSGLYSMGEVSFGVSVDSQSMSGMIAGPDCSTPILVTCDDGDPCTTNDVYDINCNCAGVFFDGDGDGLCLALDCDDTNPNITDTIPNCCMFNPLPDCDGDGIADIDEPDCDNDGTPDDCEIDLNGNGIPDKCEADCDGDGIPDISEMDCDGNGIPNDCELVNNDCNGNGIPDNCEPDCDGDGIPNACEADCDGDGLPDDCEADCDGNNIPDDCENLMDCDNDGIPDSMEADTDGDGVPDDCDICPDADDTIDTDGDGVPDGCDICPGFDDHADADGDGIPDGCDQDCNVKCNECRMEGGFGSEKTITFCCVSITIDNWVHKGNSQGAFIGFEIVAASVDGQPVDPSDIAYKVKSGGKCYDGTGPFWLHPDAASGKAKAIAQIILCENTTLCGADPVYCNSCKDKVKNDDDDDDQCLNVKPNPTMNSDVVANFQLKDAQEVTISIVSSNGNVIESTKAMGKEGENNVPLHVGDLKPGIYHILVKTSGNVLVEQFVKVTD